MNFAVFLSPLHNSTQRRRASTLVETLQALSLNLLADWVIQTRSVVVGVTLNVKNLYSASIVIFSTKVSSSPYIRRNVWFADCSFARCAHLEKDVNRSMGEAEAQEGGPLGDTMLCGNGMTRIDTYLIAQS